jgi:hypothetical protein
VRERKKKERKKKKASTVLAAGLARAITANKKPVTQPAD